MRQNDGAGQGKNEQLLAVNTVNQRTSPNDEQANPMWSRANNQDENKYRKTQLLLNGNCH